MTKQRILFITTGGTIASVRTPQGLKPVLTSEELLAHLPELNDLCVPETLALCSIDSTDLGQEHWLMMAKAVQENYADQPHVEAQVAMLIANQAADNDNQVSVQQVRQQLEEEYPLAAVPFDDYVEKSDVLEAPEQPVTVTPARIRRMESRSIHTANGIEVKIPTELLSSDNEVEFLHSDDGSISLLIKNVIL